ncbi:hypothetical protein DX908_05680 [Parvularcula marina]|uniref:Uncharacterized protein n=1 Tax=Parvularcula marina TaxID=2292771 RepID=A0A371RH88_9PROT|nr:hypothetical protein DX908_05680 [Parvularcula marina]
MAGLAAVSIGVMSAQATEPDYGDAATCYPLYFAAQDNIDSLRLLGAEDWDHLGEAQFDQRAAKASEFLGFASMASAEFTSQNESQRLRLALIQTNRPTINGMMAQLAHCDRVFGMTPVITPKSDRAKEIVSRQDRMRDIPAAEIVACYRTYDGGAKTQAVKQSPVAMLWNNGATINFSLRQSQLEQRVDVQSAFANIPMSEVNADKATLWEGKLPAAVEGQDNAAQNAFWKDVAACDAKFEMGARIEPSKLANPNPSHAECSSSYAALRGIYQTNPQAAGYFQQRGIHAARFIKLLDPSKTDQEIIAALDAKAMEKLSTFQLPDGQMDYRQVARTFAEVETCDHLYGLEPTQMPEDVYRQSRMQRD